MTTDTTAETTAAPAAGWSILKALNLDDAAVWETVASWWASLALQRDPGWRPEPSDWSDCIRLGRLHDAARAFASEVLRVAKEEEGADAPLASAYWDEEREVLVLEWRGTFTPGRRLMVELWTAEEAGAVRGYAYLLWDTGTGKPSSFLGEGAFIQDGPGWENVEWGAQTPPEQAPSN